MAPQAPKDQRAYFTVIDKPAQGWQNLGDLGRACCQAMAEPEHSCRHQDTLQGPTACYPAGKRVGAATDHKMQGGMLKARPRSIGLFICARQLQNPLVTWHLGRRSRVH